jgi:prolyl 4-hydroxylase
MWDSPPTILRVDNTSLPGGGPQLQAAIASAARDALEAWTGSPQTSTSVYGIRIYHNGSILSPHVDRLPLISSCIINVAQDVDEPWFLEVYGHDGIAHNVTMEPGTCRNSRKWVISKNHCIIMFILTNQ